MNFVYVDDLLHVKGFKSPTLDVLIPDANLYSTLLFQPCGEIIVGDYYVKNKDTRLTELKFKAFFEHSLERNIDLSITPEYSCPWTVIVHLLKNNSFPYAKGLWVIGSESILQEEFIKVVEDNDDICWIYDEELFECSESDKFLNPVCYFFSAKNATTNAIQKIIVVQFKTNQMGGHTFERDNLLKGKTIYILRNNEDSIYLATIICSDALGFNVDNLSMKQQAYLIIHIQLNSKPFNLTFSDYRRSYYLANDDEPKRRILTLNWASKTVLCGEPLIYGGSAYYTKSKKTNTNDNIININHNKGLYYSYCDIMHANIFFFNYDEFIYEFENTKGLQRESVVQQQKDTGPIMKHLYIWENDIWNIFHAPNDHLEDIGIEICCDLSSLLDKKLTPVNKERLIGLSIGNITEEKHLLPMNLSSFKVKPEADCCEVNKRLTFFQDPHPETKNEKTNCLLRFNELVNSIIRLKLPKKFKDLENNYKIKYYPNKGSYGCYQNIYSINKDIPATIVFLGQTTIPKAEATYNKMCDLFKDSLSHNRLIVWYKNSDGRLKRIYKKSSPKITSTINVTNNSLRKGEQR